MLANTLGVHGLTHLWAALVMEKRILLRASSYTALTVAAEGASGLIWPLRWIHVYIPVLPYSLVDYIEAPTPFLIGLHTSVSLIGHFLDGLIIFDLDTGIVHHSETLLPPPPEGLTPWFNMRCFHFSSVTSGLFEAVKVFIKLKIPDLTDLNCAK